ncbi:MAG: DNA translocase FtsK 4TM domain-containing protein [Rhodocyclaceae bacterium]|nr:DNA translocase FtsK 4TM domain-containing protein [Rhodocyclaceae bacterium]MCW5596273.1 DNA translocase FtsK 4TM domain-containing protein [Rhodocyclaceae bacterium]
MQEARWLVLGVVAFYIGLILYGFSKADPGWSHAAQVERIANPGGRIGAWLADLLLYLFGLSAWWWVLFFLFLVIWGYRRLEGIFHTDRRPFFIALSGFIVLIAASSGLEALRFHSAKTPLPLEPGGMLGLEVGRLFSQFLGFTGGTIILIALFAAGLTIFTGMSWLKLIERLGALLEGIWFGSIHLYQRWQDRRIGREVAREREAEVEVERKRFEAFHAEPIRIEPAEVVVPKSTRREKERQAPLFMDIPGGALPPLHLLEEPAHDVEPPSAETLEFTSRLIERKLADFGVQVKVLAAYPGPVITRYEIEPAVGVKGAQIVNLVKDIARALSVVSVRVVETIPGKSCMGLELPNPKRQTVRLSEILGSKAYHDMHSPLTLTLGKDIGGLPVVVDLAKMPHLLVAGTTGSGKSVGINAMILSLVYKSEPADVRLILVDPKMLELSIYEGIPHLLAPVVTDMKQAANALQWCVAEMDRRYRLMSALGVRNLAGFNGKIKDAAKAGAPITNPFTLTPESPEPLNALPYVVVIIDELADLMMVAGKKVEELIARLAQKARAAGIHLILATQRPSVDVITGLIKANIPTRISFQVSSKIDSRTILDQMGAEALLGQGDMLYLPPGTGFPVRVHGAFVADSEVHAVVDYLKKAGAPEYVEGILDAPGGEDGDGAMGGEDGQGGGEADPLYDQAVEVVLKTRRPSISLVQRHLRIGYNRAARLIEQMERSGLVSPMGSNGNREVIVPARQE